MISTIQNAGLFLLAAPPSGEGPNMIQTFGFMILIFVVFWFFMIRPQRQKQKRRESMLKALEKGDKVVTIGGVRGTVVKVANDVISIKVDDNCKIDFSRSAVSEVVLDEDEVARRAEALKDLKAGPKDEKSSQDTDEKKHTDEKKRTDKKQAENKEGEEAP